MANYNIRFAGHSTRMADRDAQAVHLRLLRDGVYHQYFTAPVSGISGPVGNLVEVNEP